MNETVVNNQIIETTVFNESIATCYSKAPKSEIRWFKNGNELINKCKECSWLNLFVTFHLDERSIYVCEVLEGRSYERIRYPETGQISWFRCCENQTFLYHVPKASNKEIITGIDQRKSAENVAWSLLLTVRYHPYLVKGTKKVEN